MSCYLVLRKKNWVVGFVCFVWVVAVAVYSVNFLGWCVDSVFWVCSVLPGISVFRVRFCARWMTLLYIIGS